MPSPGKCLAAGAIPDSWMPRMYSSDSSMVCSTSALQVRCEMIGFRQLRYRSTIGAKDQLQPMAAASTPEMRPSS